MYETSSVHLHYTPVLFLRDGKLTVASGMRYNVPLTNVEDEVFDFLMKSNAAWFDGKFNWGANKLTGRGYTMPYTHMQDAEYVDLLINEGVDSCPIPGVDYEVEEE